MPHQPASTAPEHIRVLDVTRVRYGPTAVRQLADGCADVDHRRSGGRPDALGHIYQRREGWRIAEQVRRLTDRKGLDR